MNAKEFKANSEILMDEMVIDFVSKKEILKWLQFTDGAMDALGDDDTHVYVLLGKTCYSDNEITPAILSKADYIEMSWGAGYMVYVGRNADSEALRDAFDQSLGHHIEIGIEFGDLIETDDGRVIKAA